MLLDAFCGHLWSEGGAGYWLYREAGVQEDEDPREYTDTQIKMARYTGYAFGGIAAGVCLTRRRGRLEKCAGTEVFKIERTWLRNCNASWLQTYASPWGTPRSRISRICVYSCLFLCSAQLTC